MKGCHRIDEVRDYAFDEVSAGARDGIRQHLAECGECALELDRLQLTTAALRILPDREIPQRIAFVSDKVFEPSAVGRLFSGFWSSAPRLGFASACVLAVGLMVSAYQPGTRHPAVAVSGVEHTDVSRQVNEAVAKAVAQVRMEDAETSRKVTQAALQVALQESDRKHEQEHRALMIAMDENLTVLQKRFSTLTMLASNDSSRFGDRQ